MSKRFQTVYETPQTVLLETDAMAGGYEAVKSWSKAYDGRAAALTMVATNFARALQHYGDILTASSYNWKFGEYTANRDPNKGDPPSLPAGIPSELPYGAGTVVGIASSGAYTNGLQTDWTELQNKVTIFVNGGQVPDGDTDKLARAAGMWKTFANSDPLEYGVAQLLNVASGLQQGFGSKDPDDVQNHVANLRNLAHKLRELRTAAVDIANAVEAHSTALSKMRTDINTQFAVVVVVTAISIGRSTINVKEQPAKEKAPSKQQPSPNENKVEIDIDFLNDAAWAIAEPANTFLTTLSSIAFSAAELTNGELLTITGLEILLTSTEDGALGGDDPVTKDTATKIAAHANGRAQQGDGTHYVAGVSAPGLAEYVRKVLDGEITTEQRYLRNGRTAYWDNERGALIIEDPPAGTVFTPANGRDSFEELE
ncbi:hypothetical protein ACFP3H_02685 [Nocardia lasii]|uniref:ESX-1 secretion-associated protein EspA/EspE-like domain-containing protein n=1 Tax=Nocardia lasii TaxID=1616107 RepID=A0ABW1JLM3_9NOCA